MSDFIVAGNYLSVVVYFPKCVSFVSIYFLGPDAVKLTNGLVQHITVEESSREAKKSQNLLPFVKHEGVAFHFMISFQ